jgi:hypothetical protein
MSARPPQDQDNVGLDRLLAHCASLDPDAPTARARLDAALEPELARKLVFALCGRGPGLGAGAIVAA